MYSMPPYPYLATDYGTQLSLFTHHMWIGGFLIVGAAAHAAIFMVRDYDPTTRYNDLLDRVLRHRDAIISHLNWASPGATAPGATASTSLTWGGGDLVAVGGKVALLPIPLGTADFLVHHIHAFTIHVTVLILLKGVLFARSSRLIPDKANLGFRFPCDGPGRGGIRYMSSIGLGSCLLRTILDVQFNFGSNIPFQLENAVRCLGQSDVVIGKNLLNPSFGLIIN
ncbi:hypothetical protein RDI58_031234 [Solanum bulbocastanum]|uniref:Photosystem I P700 chlorophyll a apoprotein A1 n=1 Tax=Solanum bulbocastanum TaxID=147425 RepID=A0AAN8XY06_SOLBU